MDGGGVCYNRRIMPAATPDMIALRRFGAVIMAS